MSIKAVFIGINKHADSSISELSGACRDATALWALFTDSVDNLTGKLLLNENATYDAIHLALNSTLTSADNNDVIIISFAGHGSPDGNLITYDTDSSNLRDTAISMTDLALRFQESKARVILFILDCCFSGQAPARVFEIDARPRNPFIYSGIYGEGRILIAACAANEVAWEQPGTGHGLLTYGIMQAMQGPMGSNIQFPDVAGEVIRMTRVEGERIGVTQTPVFLGSVQGGLVFPALQRGENYKVCFPAIPSKTINGQFSELRSYGFPDSTISQWEKEFPNGLNKLQIKTINEFGVLRGNSLLVVAPTSSGKTMIGELAAVQSVLIGKKAAFLLPYRALVNEKYEKFTGSYSKDGIRIIRCSGDSTDGVSPAFSGRYDIGFYTYETFLNMALSSPKLFGQLGTIIIDEGQFITDPNRGMIVELVLSLLSRSKSSGITPQLIVLSAVIGSLNGFDNWLNIPVLISKERPVPLIEGVLDRNGTFQFINTDGEVKKEALLESYQIVQRRDKASSQDVIVPLVKKLIANSEKIIVFRNVRGLAQGCAKYLAKELGLPAATEVVKNLPTRDLTTSSRDLKEALQGGTAFHNTNLLRPEREAVEKGFRNINGGIYALAATTTLAAGINTPASTVILAENEFLGEDGRPFTIAEYKNMAGRAGRLGFSEIGKAIILADTPMERAHLFQKYVLGVPENVTSSFKQGELSTWIIRLLSHVKGIKREDVSSLLVNTFGGYSASISNPHWIKNVKDEIEVLTQRMLNAKLAIIEGEMLHLTLLGRACATSSLKFESSLRLIEILQCIDLATILPSYIIGAIQVLAEADSIYTPIMKKGRAESKRLNEVSTRYGHAMLVALQQFAYNEFILWQRCKRASIIWDWIQGDSVENIERFYSTNFIQGAISYGDIIRIVDGTRFHLRSAHQILAVLFPQKSEFIVELDEMLVRLEFGVPAKALGLLKLPIQLTRGQYLALYHAGHESADKVLKLDLFQLQNLIGTEDAERLCEISI